MRAAPAIAIAALTLTSCARTVQDQSRMTASAAQAPRPANSKRPKNPAVEASTFRTGVRDTMDRQVRNALDAGEGDLRVAAWRKRLAASPDDLEARLELARYYKEQGFADVALEHYRLASVRFPENSELAVLVARTLDHLGNGVEARGELAHFAAIHPDASADVWSWLGILQDDAKEHAAAEKSHREALRLKSGSDAFHNNLGYNLLLQGRYTEATEEFQRALAIAPSSYLAKNNLGIALAAQPEEATSHMKSVSDPASAHSNFAAILIERGEYQSAHQQLELALGYNKEHPAALSNLALLGRLEGGGVTFRPEMLLSPWQRFLRTMGDVLFGSNDEPKPKQTADPARNDRPAPSGAGSN